MKLSYRGFLNTKHSWSLVATKLMLALQKLGHEIIMESTNGTDSIDERIRPFLGTVDPNGTCITYTVPANLAKFQSRHKVEIYNYETTVLPAGWADMLNRHADLILPSSNFQKRIFEKNGVNPKKLVIVPHGVETDLYNPQVAPIDLKTNKFKFLSVGIPHARKGFDILLQAYAEEFASTEPVCLVIKTTKKPDPRTRHHYEIDIMSEIARVQQGHVTPEIVLATNDYPNLAPLYTACDCYVSPTRSEGFGMTMLESMCCGIPCITTGYGGHMDYVDGQTSYLINYKIVPAINSTQYWHFDRRATIAQPDKDHLRKLMRHVYNAREEARQKAAKAREKVSTRYTWTRVAEQVTELIEKQRWEEKAMTSVPIDFRAKAPITYSIIIPSYNKVDLLFKCVDSLLKVTSEDIQIIIVDNGSLEPEFKRIAVKYNGNPRIIGLHNDRNQGFARACNAGIAMAQGQYVVLLNNDTEITDPDWLKKMKETLDAGAWLTGPAGGILNDDLDYVRETFSNEDPISYVSGWCLMFHRDLLNKIGNVPEEFGLAFFEDSVTSDRCVIIQNKKEEIEVLPIEKLFERFRSELRIVEGKEVIDLRMKGYKSLSFDSGNKENVASLTEKEKKGLVKFQETGIRSGFLDDGTYYDMARIEKAIEASQNLVSGKWNLLKAIVRHKAKKEISYVSQKYGSTCITADHSLIINRQKDFQALSYQELRNGDKMTKVISIPKEKKIKQIDLIEYLPLDVKQYLSWDQDFIWDNSKLKLSDAKCKRILNSDAEINSLVQLLAAYISEGSSRQVFRRSRKMRKEMLHQVGCSIYNTNYEWLKERIANYNGIFIQTMQPTIAILTRKGSTTGFGICKGDVYQINFCGGKLIGLLLEGLCGVGAKQKRIPNFLYHIDDALKQIFLKVIIEGDGNRLNPERKSVKNCSVKYIEQFFMYTTASLQLVSGLSLLITQLGIRFSINHKAFNSYCIRVVKNRQSIRNLVFQKKERKYDGYVYDLSVDKAENFVDGCGLIVLHNTQMSYRVKQLGGVIAITEGIGITHLGHATAKEMNLKETYLHAREIFKKKWLTKDFEVWLSKADLPLVSILTLTYNAHSLLKDTVESVLRNTRYPNWEWLIADNGSEDASVAYLRSLQDPRIKITERGNNNGNFASINNELALKAQGKYLVFLNNDMVALEGWLEHMIYILDNDYSVGCVGSRLLYPESYNVQHCGVTFQRNTKYPGHIFLNLPQGQVIDYLEEDREYQCVTAACSAVRKEEFEKLGMLDSTFHYVFEDVDLCLRVCYELNKKIVYASKSILFHVESATRIKQQRTKEEEDKRIRPYLYKLTGKWKGIVREDGNFYYAAKIQKSSFKVYQRQVQDVIKLSFVTCVSNFAEYEANVVRSLDNSILKNFELIPIDNTDNKYSAAQALNLGIDKAKSNIIVTCHQDVIFDSDFTIRLIEKVNHYFDFGTLGVAGITANEKTAGGVRFLTDYKFAIYPEAEVIINDELCLIFRKDSGLKFDEELFNGFHFYGADLCLQAIGRGLKNYAIDCGLIHLSIDGAGNIDELKKNYFPLLIKLREKWKHVFPSVRTTSGFYKEGKEVRTFIKELQSEEVRWN